MPLGPFDLTGGPFLGLFGTLLALAIVAGLIIPVWLRPAGRARSVDDPDALAILAGRRPRFVDTVVARMLARGTLAMAGREHFVVRDASGARTAAEQAVARLSAPIRWPAIDARVKPLAEPIERQLQRDGLLLDGKALGDLRFYAVLPYVTLIAFGAIKAMIGDARERPIGFLSVLLIATLVVAAIRWFTVDRRTRAGIDAVRMAAANNDRVRRAPTEAEMPLAVALFGTAVLAGSGFDDFHRLRATPDSSGSSGGSDSGSDGGGCGGGGCGGCGG